MKPLIRRSGLSNPPRYYLLTRYRIDGDAVIASTKYDITDEIEALGLAAPPAPLPQVVERLRDAARRAGLPREDTVANIEDLAREYTSPTLIVGHCSSCGGSDGWPHHPRCARLAAPEPTEDGQP